MIKKNLLFICGNIMANSSQGVRYQNLLPNLANHYSITLLSGNKFIDSPEIKNINLSQQTVQPKSKASAGSEQVMLLIKLKRLYKKYIRPFIFPDKTKYKIPLYKRAIKELLLENKFEAVIVAMTPYSLYVLPQFIKEQDSSITTIVDLSDPFFNNAGNNYAFIYRKDHIERFERRNIRYIDHIVVLNPRIKELYQKIYRKKNIHVIEQGLNEDIFRQSKTKHKKNKKLLLIYGGGLYHKLREPFELYAAVNQLTQSVEFRIYGNIFKSLQPEPGEKIKYFGQINQHKLAEEYSIADIVVFIDNAEGMQVPGKVLELLALCKPILFIYSNPESPSLYYASKSEWVVKVKNNREDILKGIEKIVSSNFNTLPNPDLSIYQWKNLAKNYKKIING